jgi:predicted MFS family arabinose efflux permease
MTVTGSPPLSRGMILLLAVTCGAAVGNLYFPQALTPLVAAGLHVPPGAATLVVTAVQAGYTAGMFLVVPLGDRFRHRPLVVTLLVLTSLALAGASVAPALPALVGASALVGLTTVAAQVIAPMTAGLVPAERRGAAFGTLMSGSLGGMLLSRAFGGVLGQWLGWRAPYLLAAAVIGVIAVILAQALPATAAPPRRRYPALLAESARLLRTEPELRRSAFYQATVFGAFSAVWTGVALLLTGPAYGLGASAVGVLALVNAGTMVCTPVSGRLVDRHGPDRVNLVTMAATMAAVAILLLGGRGGAAGLAALVAGTLLLDVAMQSGMIANQVRIFALRPGARSMLNSAYMTCAYAGGAAGSWLGAAGYGRAGWPGVCAAAAALTGLALGRHLLRRRRPAVPGVPAAQFALRPVSVQDGRATGSGGR